jgi:hypothetical protein
MSSKEFGPLAPWRMTAVSPDPDARPGGGARGARCSKTPIVKISEIAKLRIANREIRKVVRTNSGRISKVRKADEKKFLLDQRFILFSEGRLILTVLRNQ